MAAFLICKLPTEPDCSWPLPTELSASFAPVMEPKDRDRRLKGWKKAVRAALYFANDEEE